MAPLYARFHLVSISEYQSFKMDWLDENKNIVRNKTPKEITQIVTKEWVKLGNEIPRGGAEIVNF